MMQLKKKTLKIILIVYIVKKKGIINITQELLPPYMKNC